MADPPGVSVAFDAAWDTVSPTWTRIDTLTGCRVRGWSIDRGRPDEFSKTDVGTARVSIVDRQGLFDPTYASSPYNGKILPGKQAAVALQNPVGDVWHTLFRGHIESWTYKLDPTRQYMELELQLVDGFATLSRMELQPGVHGNAIPAGSDITGVFYENTAVGAVKTRLDDVLDDVGWPAAWRDLFSGNVNLSEKVYSAGTSALAALQDAADGEWPGVSNLWCSKTNMLTFRGRQARFRPDVAEYGIAKRTVGDPSATESDSTVVPVSELEWAMGSDNVFNACSASPEKVADVPFDQDLLSGQYVSDTTSVAAYGLRSITFDNLQTRDGLATGNDAAEETLLFAHYYVDNFKTPASRISRLVFRSRRPGDPNGPALWQHLCLAEISDLLTVKSRHPGPTPTYPSGHPTGGGFNDQFYVEGLHYACQPGNADYPIVELSLDVSPRAHYTTNPFDSDPDPGP